jgi:prephenate dehydratase
MKKVAIQGIQGCFHDIAAHKYFKDEEIELVCCETFEDLFRAMHNDNSIYGMCAIENTIAGSLLHNYELLRESGMTIIGEQKIHVEHSLLCLPDDSEEDIVEINTHPVALMQCRQFVKTMPQCKLVEANDTAGSAEMIKRLNLHGHAAICAKEAVPIYGMKVLHEAIEDNKHNFTRFLVLCDPWNAEKMREKAKCNKSSLVFSVHHECGQLSQVLSIFSFYHINMTKIQSLPIIGHEWEYLFYVDLTYTDYVHYRQSIDAIRPLTQQLTILGEYESDN